MTATEPRISLFVSYSRQELYFAEEVVLRLQDANLNVWFDIQQLASGIDWSQAIASGLANCNGLVLIASQSSMQSPYVAKEWQTVLNSGKPIYVLLFESVDLGELKDRAQVIIDCRARFGHNINRLINAVQMQQPTKDRLPHSLPFSLPARVPYTVGVVAVALIWITAILLFTTFTIFNLYATSLVAGLIVSGMMVARVHGFLRRQFYYHQLRWILFFAAFTLPFLLTLYPAIFAISAVLLWYAFFLTFVSKEMLRWAPRGQGPEALRGKRALPNPFARRIVFTPTDLKYVIHCRQEDRPVGNAVRRAMTQAGFQEGWKVDNVSTDYHLIVLSNFTTLADYESLVNTSDKIVWVLASPLEDDAQYKSFENRQWVDFRNQKYQTLLKMAEELRGDSELALIRKLSLNVTPEDFKMLVVPPSVTAVGLLLFVVMVLIVSLVVSFLRTVVHQNMQQAALVTAFFIIPPFLLIIGAIRLNHQILRREIRHLTFVLTLGLPFLLIGVALAFLQPLALAVCLLVVGVIFLLSRNWLPPTRLNLPRRDFLGLRKNELLWRNDFVAIIFIVLMTYSLAGNWVNFTTPAVDPGKVAYTQVNVDPNLSLSIPAEWYSQGVQTTDQFVAFETHVNSDLPLLVFVNRATNRPLHDGTEFGLKVQTYQQALSAYGQLESVALYEPADTASYILLMAWQADGDGATRLLTDKQQNPSIPVETKSYRVQDTTIDCVHLKPNNHEWYCAIHSEGITPSYFLVLQVTDNLLNEQAPVIDSVLGSATLHKS